MNLEKMRECQRYIFLDYPDIKPNKFVIKRNQMKFYNNIFKIIIITIQK